MTATPAVPPLPASIAAAASRVVQKPFSVFPEYGGDRSPRRPTDLRSEAEETSSEAFQTPREESAPAFGVFGEELGADEDAEEPKQRKSARTLSLSQLTLGKGPWIQI